MMGFVWLAVMASVGLALLWLMKLRGPVLTLAAAAILFGCAGYAWQGRPSLSGTTRTGAQRVPPTLIAELRRQFTGQFDYADAWLNMSDALASRGNTRGAALLLQTQAEQHPGDYKLWLGLGNALVEHSGTLSPAAEMAFDRSEQLAPGHPAPLFFRDIALARSGRSDEAVRGLVELIQAHPKASWRPAAETVLISIVAGSRSSAAGARPGQAGS